MENLSDRQKLQDRNDSPQPPGPEFDELISLLPKLYYAVNRVLEDCTPRFSKKVGVALWALAGSKKQDTLGYFLTTHDLVDTLRSWFVVSETSASSAVSKVKDDLFGLDYIRIEAGNDHIHLSENGQKAFLEMTATARKILQDTVGVLGPSERTLLLDFAKRMIATQKKPAGSESFEFSFPEP